jgi:hypothetical protein
VLETKLFGNPLVHLVDVYVESINDLVERLNPAFEAEGLSERSAFTLVDDEEESLFNQTEFGKGREFTYGTTSSSSRQLCVCAHIQNIISWYCSSSKEMTSQ